MNREDLLPQLSRRDVLSGAALGSALLAGMSRAVPPPGDDERLRNDWPFLGRYRADNERLLASGQAVESVFLGDSITEGWRNADPGFFSAGRVCRGIGGQTTPQMLVRFRADVVRLRPRIVHLMAGTNDIAGNTGPSTPEMTQDNLQSMTELALASKLAVILASIPPAASFPWRPGLETADAILSMNQWLRDYATRVGAVYADYHGAMSNGRGGMRPGLASDEVHPTAEGYAVMRPVAEAALQAARK